MTEKKNRPRWLRKGERFRLPADCYAPDRLLPRPVFEVLDVTVCAAKVRSTDGRRTAFETFEGEAVAFEAPGRPVYFSPTALVERID